MSSTVKSQGHPSPEKRKAQEDQKKPLLQKEETDVSAGETDGAESSGADTSGPETEQGDTSNSKTDEDDDNDDGGKAELAAESKETDKMEEPEKTVEDDDEAPPEEVPHTVRWSKEEPQKLVYQTEPALPKEEQHSSEEELPEKWEASPLDRTPSSPSVEKEHVPDPEDPIKADEPMEDTYFDSPGTTAEHSPLDDIYNKELSSTDTTTTPQIRDQPTDKPRPMPRGKKQEEDSQTTEESASIPSDPCKETFMYKKDEKTFAQRMRIHIPTKRQYPCLDMDTEDDDNTIPILPNPYFTDVPTYNPCAATQPLSFCPSRQQRTACKRYTIQQTLGPSYTCQQQTSGPPYPCPQQSSGPQCVGQQQAFYCYPPPPQAHLSYPCPTGQQQNMYPHCFRQKQTYCPDAIVPVDLLRNPYCLSGLFSTNRTGNNNSNTNFNMNNPAVNMDVDGSRYPQSYAAGGELASDIRENERIVNSMSSQQNLDTFPMHNSKQHTLSGKLKHKKDHEEDQAEL